MGLKTYKQIVSLVVPAKPGDKTYGKLIQFVSCHHNRPADPYSEVTQETINKHFLLHGLRDNASSWIYWLCKLTVQISWVATG